LKDSKRVYFGRRLEALEALAKKYWLGNFSMMVVEALTKRYNLDPDTGIEPKGNNPHIPHPKPPDWPPESRRSRK
jgi:hypothetical protein